MLKNAPFISVRLYGDDNPYRAGMNTVLWFDEFVSSIEFSTELYLGVSNFLLISSLLANWGYEKGQISCL